MMLHAQLTCTWLTGGLSPPCSCADGDAAYQTGLVGPFEVASAAASRLPRLKAFMYEGPYGDCRAGLAALKVADLQVCLSTLPMKLSGVSSFP